MTKEEKAEKRDFAKTMTKQEIEMIEQERKIKQKTVDQSNPVAHKLAALSDADYAQFIKQISACERTLFAVLSTKAKIEKNMVEITKGSTEQKYSSGPFEGKEKTTDDLVSENIINNDILFEGIEGIRQVLTNLYFSHVGNIRLGDREVYFDEEQWNKYVAKVSDKLKKHGIDLFVERQKKLLEG